MALAFLALLSRCGLVRRVGENEKICPPLLALERLKTVAPRITTQLIAGAGHDLTLVKAVEVNRAVLNFLAR